MENVIFFSFVRILKKDDTLNDIMMYTIDSMLDYIPSVTLNPTRKGKVVK